MNMQTHHNIQLYSWALSIWPGETKGFLLCKLLDIIIVCWNMFLILVIIVVICRHKTTGSEIVKKEKEHNKRILLAIRHLVTRPFRLSVSRAHNKWVYANLYSLTYPPPSHLPPLLLPLLRFNTISFWSIPTIIPRLFIPTNVSIESVRFAWLALYCSTFYMKYSLAFVAIVNIGISIHFALLYTVRCL